MTTGPSWGTPDETAPDDGTPAWGSPDTVGPEQVTLSVGPGFLGPFVAAVYDLFHVRFPGKRYLVGLVALAVPVAGLLDGSDLAHGAQALLAFTGLFLVLALVVTPFGIAMRGTTWTASRRELRMTLAWDHRGAKAELRTVKLPWHDARRAILTDQYLAVVTRSGYTHAIALKGADPAAVATVVRWLREAGVEVQSTRS